MSCNCAPSSNRDLWTQVPDSNQATFQQVDAMGNTTECSEGYLARAGNPTGLQTGAQPADPTSPLKIATVSITAKCDMSINFQMTSTNPSAPNQTWAFNDQNGNPLTISGITFSSAGLISGSFPSESTYQIQAVLSSNGTQADSKPYSVVVQKCQPGAAIKFIHPLPGAVMTSPCGNRVHPVTGQLKPHKGIDLAYGDHHLGNVLASADGQVIIANVQNGYGNVVYIGHTNAAGKKMCVTKYAHLSKIGVTVGQQVSSGDVIGIEGNTGIGTGAHLHFEIRSGSGQNDTVYDPAVYISGGVVKSSNCGTVQPLAFGTLDTSGGTSSSPTPGTPTPAPNPPAGTPDPGTIPSTATLTTTDNGDVGLTPAKVDAGCAAYTPDTTQTLTGTDPTLGSKTSTAPATSPYQSGCKPNPYTPPTQAEVIQRITAVCQSAGVDQEGINLILFIAKIESGYDPYAMCPTSSATGLFQFLDGLANKYFPQIGSTSTCPNRCNIELATQAMVAFYNDALLPYYNGWVASGMTTIIGKQIVSTPHSATYPTLTKGCWIYGLIHHDGVGNAIKGIDKQGCEYYMSKINGTAPANS